jgi:probable HAF family extracellular repeat protein
MSARPTAGAPLASFFSVEVLMQTFPPRHRRPAGALRPSVVRLATLAVALACRPDAPLPTQPRVTPPVAPRATVVGASVVVLPTLGGSRQTVGSDINDAGQVVGQAYTSGDIGHAFLWTPGQAMRDLGTLGGPGSHATAVNNAGQVVGFSDLPIGPTGLRHAFLWTSTGGMQDLGSIGQFLGESFALGINDAGQIVGWSRVVPNGGLRAFLWTQGAGMQDLGSLGPNTNAMASGINNFGHVVGQSGLAPPNTAASHAVLWTPAQGLQDLGTLGGSISEAVAINNAGQIVGWSYTSDTAPWTNAAFFTPGQGARDLGTLAGGRSQALAINDAGQVVGFSVVGGEEHAFLWTASGGLEDISHVTGISAAVAINNNGQVVGNNRVASLWFKEPNRAPEANAGGPYTGHKKKPVAFDAGHSTDPDGDALTYSWNFGDGSALGSGATPVHDYETWGTYMVTLTVTDAGGLSATSTTTATIAPPGQLRDRQ